jgi:hypothetical protein
MTSFLANNPRLQPSERMVLTANISSTGNFSTLNSAANRAAERTIDGVFEGTNKSIDKKIALCGTQHSGRKSIEDYISKQFLEVYGATITHFMPQLLSLTQGDKTLAALGVKPATDQPLFLQQYLPDPVDRCIATIAKAPTHLNKIVEIGNLVVTKAGSSHLLFILLTQILSLAGYEWVVFTGTPAVKKSLERFGFQLHLLAEATIDRLPSINQSNWGTYYEQRPMVLAGNISGGIKQLKESRWSSTLSFYAEDIEFLAAEIGRSREA